MTNVRKHVKESQHSAAYPPAAQARVGARHVMLEVDLKPMVGWLLASNEPRLSLMNLIQACKKELEKYWEVHIVHVYKNVIEQLTCLLEQHFIMIVE